ncbi:sensor histidine kinase [Stigmatella erecta]|uniref:histidine kinase n=1 Tax=Stigmatella erecta TaxID=83460 RepID=A0A1I0L7Z9_9BACT|nr:ATP-binding protein [Stigmatella erecta]SEU35795.1 His Kinase A (phospho-acceptor) domain-containing protein [Stigmatella erecta]
MSAVQGVPPPEPRLEARTVRLFAQHQQEVWRWVDRLFAGLLAGQWVVAIVLALFVSPYGWAGRSRELHVHVYAAVFLGAALSAFPICLVWLRPGSVLTRHVVAISQLLWSSLLIHLTGGRIETHFHIFGSLAFLAFYRDWPVLLSATGVVVVDHLLRGLFWPESIYGVANRQEWRFLEHAVWVAFIDWVLIRSCVGGRREMWQSAERQAAAELATEREHEKSLALDQALQELRAAQEQAVRVGKLAAVGQLAASVGHELRNPLAAVRNAHSYLAKRLAKPEQAVGDARVPQLLGLMDRELGNCARIISDLLDFARERPLSLQPCPLRPLVEEAVGVVPPRESVRVLNQVPEQLPVPMLDREQFRQVLINLVQNAVEAIPADRPGQVVVRAEGGEGGTLCVRVVDNGEGIPTHVLPHIFEPLFTTKAKGTGLGLAIVASRVERHGGSLHVASERGQGSEFIIQLPVVAAQAA